MFNKLISQITLKQIRYFAIIFAGFIITIGLLQYFWVKDLIINDVTNQARDWSKQLNESLINNGDFDINKYNRDLPQVPNFYIIKNNGLIIDNTKAGNFISGVVSKVKPIDKNWFTGPVVIITELREPWKIKAKKINGGYIIVGTYDYKISTDIDNRINKAIESFGNSVDKILTIKVPNIDEDLNWSLVDDNYNLLKSEGGIPLYLQKNDFQIKSEFKEFKTFKKKNYLVIYEPIIGKNNEVLGTIIIPQDLTLINSMLKSLRNFDVVVVTSILISCFIIFLLWLKSFSKLEFERQKIKDIFKYYVSKHIIEMMIKNPENVKLGGKRKEITVLFSDIRSFTSLSEELEPEQLTTLLHDYFNAMTEEILKTDGVVDKFIGDAIMAFWGDPIDQPNHADRAVETAINMMKRLKQLNIEWQKRGYKLIDIGVGINTGNVIVGNMGSVDRFDYTAIGDNVNIAARVESLNKKYNSNILITDLTLKKLKIIPSVEDLGEVDISGRVGKIKIYKVGTE